MSRAEWDAGVAALREASAAPQAAREYSSYSRWRADRLRERRVGWAPQRAFQAPLTAAQEVGWHAAKTLTKLPGDRARLSSTDVTRREGRTKTTCANARAGVGAAWSGPPRAALARGAKRHDWRDQAPTNAPPRTPRCRAARLWLHEHAGLQLRRGRRAGLLRTVSSNAQSSDAGAAAAAGGLFSVSVQASRPFARGGTAVRRRTGKAQDGVRRHPAPRVMPARPGARAKPTTMSGRKRAPTDPLSSRWPSHPHITRG